MLIGVILSTMIIFAFSWCTLTFSRQNFYRNKVFHSVAGKGSVYFIHHKVLSVIIRRPWLKLKQSNATVQK